MRTVASDEGFMALYNGFFPAVQRQIVFAGLRIGLYEKVGIERVTTSHRCATST